MSASPSWSEQSRRAFAAGATDEFGGGGGGGHLALPGLVGGGGSPVTSFAGTPGRSTPGRDHRGPPTPSLIAGPAAPDGIRGFSDIHMVKIPRFRRMSDASGRADVVFYEVLVVSATHRWTVLKRFSDFVDFHGVASGRLKLGSGGFVALPELPSRFTIGAQSDASVEKRRSQLEEYLHAWLARLTAVEASVRALIAAPTPDGEKAEKKLVAALSHVVSFLRHSSVTSGTVAPGEVPVPRHAAWGSGATPGVPPAPLVHDASADADDAESAAGSAAGVGDSPKARILLRPGEVFLVMLYVPGIPMRDVYVVPNDEQPRYYIVGGRWNTLTASKSTGQVIAQVLDRLQGGAGASPSPKKKKALPPEQRLAKAEVLFDTLPLGEFEVTFEVPEPFDQERWFTDYNNGVLSVIWTELEEGKGPGDTAAAAPAGGGAAAAASSREKTG